MENYFNSYFKIFVEFIENFCRTVYEECENGRFTFISQIFTIVETKGKVPRRKKQGRGDVPLRDCPREESSNWSQVGGKRK